MKFPVRFVTVAICLTFVVCALVRETMPLVGKLIDLKVLMTIREVQKGMYPPANLEINQ